MESATGRTYRIERETEALNLPEGSERAIQINEAQVSPCRVYLEQLAQLKAAIHRARTAIAENDVMVLEESIRDQEALCSHLKSLLSPMVRETDRTSVESVRSATASLRELTLTYSLLLEHAEAHARQLHRLCRSYTV